MFTQLISLDDTQLSKLPPQSLVFLHTPLCGTCKVARRMLEVVAALQRDIPIFEVDANFVPDTLQAWQISSVPALVYLAQGKVASVQYAFSGVAELVERIAHFLGSDTRP
ncbi:Thioredoxin [Alicyclobacillus hesperidum]|uniref:Thioredoxin n=1 Tax=Alicyclobacillus hesperidum TaxID=89784 RepID=A0A1H2UMZ4_9BACL|nr:thioredoxin family protein [Alicyclobacillus hesperidum]SDW57318.1 Thioredoxin [Alicyclobacillus hesperidum]